MSSVSPAYPDLARYCPMLCVIVIQGWVNEDKIRRHAFPPAADTRVLVCGLPGVYDKLCGPRVDPTVAPGTALHNTGYTVDGIVIKL